MGHEVRKEPQKIVNPPNQERLKAGRLWNSRSAGPGSGERQHAERNEIGKEGRTEKKKGGGEEFP